MYTFVALGLAFGVPAFALGFAAFALGDFAAVLEAGFFFTTFFGDFVPLFGFVAVFLIVFFAAVFSFSFFAASFSFLALAFASSVSFTLFSLNLPV